MLKKIFNAIIKYNEKRAKQIAKFYTSYRTLSELSQMSDKELRDIGINRHDIPIISFKG
jgi:uncharacterized protein YjiS (DUF1127 family)